MLHTLLRCPIEQAKFPLEYFVLPTFTLLYLHVYGYLINKNTAFNIIFNKPCWLVTYYRYDLFHWELIKALPVLPKLTFQIRLPAYKAIIQDLKGQSKNKV